MTDKEKFDALAALANFRLGRMQDRTKREAQMAFAVWAIIIFAIAYLHPRPPEGLLIMALVFVVIVHTWFVIEVWARNILDGRTARYYFARAERLFTTDSPEPGDRPNYEKEMSFAGRDWKALVWQDFWWSGMTILITAVLASSAYLLVGKTVVLGKVG